MSTANRLHIIDIQWPDWKNYILNHKCSKKIGYLTKPTPPYPLY